MEARLGHLCGLGAEPPRIRNVRGKHGISGCMLPTEQCSIKGRREESHAFPLVNLYIFPLMSFLCNLIMALPLLPNLSYASNVYHHLRDMFKNYQG
ncbi:hypothetical protein BDZ91DRAFT_86540 [Kalaharituber pfeilii]|nr:hypothetical protein BDZ91DRAFT_86540 [Kalaharituber pfeilii]